jgi:hypothetical protein
LQHTQIVPLLKHSPSHLTLLTFAITLHPEVLHRARRDSPSSTCFRLWSTSYLSVSNDFGLPPSLFLTESPSGSSFSILYARYGIVGMFRASSLCDCTHDVRWCPQSPSIIPPFPCHSSRSKCRSPISSGVAIYALMIITSKPYQPQSMPALRPNTPCFRVRSPRRVVLLFQRLIATRLLCRQSCPSHNVILWRIRWVALPHDDRHGGPRELQDFIMKLYLCSSEPNPFLLAASEIRMRPHVRRGLPAKGAQINGADQLGFSAVIANVGKREHRLTVRKEMGGHEPPTACLLQSMQPLPLILYHPAELS